MVLSVTEKSFLYDSLSSSPCLRPDGRQQHQIRPIEVSTDFLPSSNGSSRVVISDGSECIVSVKSKVVDHTVDSEVIELDVDIAGQRDDTLMVESINSLLKDALHLMDLKKLCLTQKYSFKIMIDVLVVSTYSNPISLISFGIFSALNTTYLPKLVSAFDDLEVEELPMFHDYDMEKLALQPPLVFLIAIIGDNLLVDPEMNESEVANNGLILTWNDGKVISPIRTISLNDSFCKGFKPSLLNQSIDIIEQYAPDVADGLKIKQ